MAEKKWSEYTPQERKGGIIVLVVLFLLIGGCYKCSSSDNTKTEQTQSAPTAQSAPPTPAQQLAIIDANSNSPLDVNDSRVVEIQRHLTSLATAFGQPESDIANATYAASLEMTKKGLSYNNIHLLVIADKDLDTYKQVGIKYQEFLALVVMMTTKNE